VSRCPKLRNHFSTCPCRIVFILSVLVIIALNQLSIYRALASLGDIGGRLDCLVGWEGGERPGRQRRGGVGSHSHSHSRSYSHRPSHC
jgi:hypothetical protein